MADDREAEKALAARRAAELVADGMRVGLGSGTTVAHLLPALAARRLDVTCVATSPATAATAEELGLRVEPGQPFERLDIAIDGADQITPDGWLVKGGGRAHTREKVVAAAAARFVVIAGGDKLVARLRPPIPLELLAFGLTSTLAALAHAAVRPGPPSPDGGVIADWQGPVDDPATLAAYLDTVPGVVAHGLFPAGLATDVIVADGGRVEHRQPAGPARPPRS
jgi:ribose 5-phosphate isomerase A